MTKRKKNKRFDFNKFSTWLGFLASLVTIIGFGFAIYTYIVSVKPLIDLEKLERETEELKELNLEMGDKHEYIESQLESLNEEYLETQIQKEELSSNLENAEKTMLTIRKELIKAYADIYFAPVISKLIESNTTLVDEAIDIKEYAVIELTAELEKTGLSEYKKESLELLLDFTEENIKSDSNINEALNYINYVFEYLYYD